MRVDLPREPLQVVRPERWVAVALEHEPATPDRADLLAFAEHLRPEAVSGAELDERAVGDGQLLVRGRREGPVHVAGEERRPGRQIDRHRGRLGRCDRADAKGALELPRGARRGRVGSDRGEQGHEAPEGGQASPEGHAEIVPEKSRSF